MTRLAFKPEFVVAIVNGEKNLTIREKLPPGIKPGITVAAVCRIENRPAFLVPADKAFANLNIISVEQRPLDSITEEEALRAGHPSRKHALRWYALCFKTEMAHFIEFAITETRFVRLPGSFCDKDGNDLNYGITIVGGDG